MYHKRPFYKAFFITSVFICFYFFSYNAFAFKVETHVWVGQQVLNDVSDGLLSIPIGGVDYSIPVAPHIVEALKNYPGQFRMGNIGPDALPDMYTGQMIVHPGEGGWKTDQWLQHILNNAVTGEELALAYGYLGHAAADTFSHTYVNLYSGDKFVLTDGEIDVEQRHILLEKYIEKHTPPLLDANGSYIGKASDVITTPSAFIRDRLIFNDTVANNYKNGGATHLYLVNKLRNGLYSTNAKVEEINAKIASLIIEYKYGIKINSEYLQEFFAAEEELRDAISSGADNLQELHNKFIEKYGDVIDGASNLIQQLTSNTIDFITLSGRYEEVIRDLADAQSTLANTAETIYVEVCYEACGLSCWGVWPFDEICENVCNQVCDWTAETNPLFIEYSNLVNSLFDEKNKLADEVQAVKDTLNSLIDLAATAYQVEINLQNDLLNAAIDLAQRYATDINPVSAHLEGWIDDVEVGMREYVIANESFIRATMTGDNPLTPLSDWLSCWGLAVTGIVPAPVTTATCTAIDRFNEINEKLDEVLAYASQIDPITRLVMEIKQEITEKLYKIAEDLVYELAEKLTDVDVERIVSLFKGDITAADLDSIFGHDDSTKDLLLINDISTRVNAEMNITNEGYFDPEKYHVIYNSVILAKLALLEPGQLQELAAQAGITVTDLYGGCLFGCDTSGSTNILFDAIANIDGNHQWQPVAPPYPRNATPLLDGKWNMPQYGYFYDDGANFSGFRYWEHAESRKAIFTQLFKGPIAPGIETPTDLVPGLADILPADYPFRACAENPFPHTIDDDHKTVLDIDDTCGGLAIPVAFTGGTISQDSFLLSNSTYLMTSDLIVPVGVTLTIKKGSTLMFVAGTSLIVNGSLIVEGTNASPVNFSVNSQVTATITSLSSMAKAEAYKTDSKQSKPGPNNQWGGIVIQSGTTDNIINGAIITGAETAISFVNSGGVVKNSTISNNNMGVYVTGSSQPRVNNNVIVENRYGVYVDGDKSAIAPLPIVTDNSIYDNKPFNYYANWFMQPDGIVLNASDNWWGTAHYPEITADIFPGKGSTKFAPRVEILPYLIHLEAR